MAHQSRIEDTRMVKGRTDVGHRDSVCVYVSFFTLKED